MAGGVSVLALGVSAFALGGGQSAPTVVPAGRQLHLPDAPAGDIPFGGLPVASRSALSSSAPGGDPASGRPWPPARTAPARCGPRRTLLAAACVAGGALPYRSVPAPCPAASSTWPRSRRRGGSDAVALLETAYQRSRTGTYHGVQLVMVDNQPHQVGVSHVPGHTYLYARGPDGGVRDDDPTAATPSDRPAVQGPAGPAQAALPAHRRRHRHGWSAAAT